MVNRSDILAQIEALKAKLAEEIVPTLCEGCGAHLNDNPQCEYCGRFASLELPEEPPDIRKTNAADDPCGLCGTVHSKDPYAPVICRCQKCGNLGVVGISTYDPLLGPGVVCKSCCQGVAPQNVGQPLPWHQ